MMSPMLSTIFVTLALCVALVAVFFAALSYRGCRRAQENVTSLAQWTRDNSKKSVSLLRIAKCESSITELTDSYDALLASQKKLRARIHMRKARDKRHESGDLDESELSSEQDKNALRLKAKAAGLLR